MKGTKRSDASRRRLGIAVLAALGPALAGCGDSSTAPEPPGITTNHTDPAAVIGAHAEALTERDHRAYLALLDPGFRFYVFGEDAIDFLWLTEDWWAYQDEAGMIGNMMDDGYSGDEIPVESIRARLEIRDRQEIDGVTRLTVDAIFEVLVGPNDGWASDTRLLFDLAPDGRGFLRIRAIHEVQRVSPAIPTSIEAKSWSEIKEAYR